MFKKTIFTLISLFAVLVLTNCGASSSEPLLVKKTEAGEISFNETIGPLLETHCGKCHWGEKPAGGLIVLSYDQVMKGGTHGPVIIPGDPDKSRIITSVEKTKEPHMPPKFFRELGKDRIDVLRQWIQEGAKNN